MRKLISRVLPLVLVLVLAIGCLSAMAAETPALPSATITEVQNDDLTFAMNFRADIVTDEQLAYYGDWYADFVLTFSKPVTLNANGGADGYLSGQYDAWSENWVNVPFEDVSLEANKGLKIMEYASQLMGKPGLKYTFREVYQTVQDFDCGVFLENDYILNNPDAVITLELRVFNNENETESYRIGDLYEFRFNFVARNTATGKLYEDVSDALTAAQAGQTVELLKDATDDVVAVYDATTLDLAGYTLTADYVSSFGDTVDNSAANTGALATKHLMIQPDNQQVTVKTAKGYQFFEVLSFTSAYIAAQEKFCFVPEFEAAALELLTPGVATTGVTVQVNVSWQTADGHTRAQKFYYSDEFVNGFIASYDPATEWYGKMFFLTLKNTADFSDLSFEAMVISDTGVYASEADANDVETSGNVVTKDTTITHENGSALVPAGTVLDEGATALVLSATEMEETQSNVTLSDGETMLSMDVCVEGVSKENTTPIIVTLNEVTLEGLNIGNIALYHVENGVTTEMTRVFSIDEVDAHNEYYYDIETGTITMALASFSEISFVTKNTAPWEGDFDYTWYDADATELTIANADQLAAFGAIVGDMKKYDTDGTEIIIAQDSFTGKTVKLINNINLADDEDNNDEDKIFYPIGYNNSTGSYEKVSGGSVTSTVYSFEGTFDGTGHTVANFYQNTWEMFGDYNNGYPAGSNHYKDAMGLFGYVVGGDPEAEVHNVATIKNLTVENFSSDGEFTPTGVITAYAKGAVVFENIALFNCNPRVYNTGNGGIVGWDDGGDAENDATENTNYTFRNITIDKSNMISALWGSWDVGCGGVMGYLGPYSTAHFEDCHIAAIIDVYNDVCANYQYYWYRYCGMLIGTVDRTKTDDNGYTVLDLNGITATKTSVNFGDWNDYWYCELVANTLASYTHDHQFSRLTKITSLSDIQSGDTWLKTGNFLLNEECYHIMKNDDGTLYRHTHDMGGKETTDVDKDGTIDSTLDKEDKYLVNLPFNQVFGGYGWGVKGTDKTEMGITITGITSGTSTTSSERFESKGVNSVTTNTTIKVGDLFAATATNIRSASVQVAASCADNSVTAVYTANTSDWTQGTITFTGTGTVSVSITDYFYCTPTIINVTINERVAAEKFDVVLDNGDFLHRVGNKNAVTLDKLFKAKDGAEIGTVSVTVETINGASGTYTSNATWTSGTIQFTGTGVVKVTITDNDYCTPTELLLEVVTATNHTGTTAPSATGKDSSGNENSYVLLNNVSGSFSINSGNTLYGNAFTVTLPTTYQASYTAGFVGYVSMSGGNLDNVRIEGPVYPVMNIYQSQAQNSTTNKEEYFYNSILIYGGNNSITNSYISGSRTAVCIRGANSVVIEDTTLSGGAVANLQIEGVNTVTLRNLTTVQKDETDSYGQGATAHGMGVMVGASTAEITIEGELNQYNWLSYAQWKAIVGSYESSFPYFYTNTKYAAYQHTRDGETYVNIAFVFACDWDTEKLNVENQTNKDIYQKLGDVTVSGYNGGVYSVANQGTVTDEMYNAPGYESTGFDPVAPVFSFDNAANNDDDDENDAADTYCVYDEDSGILKIGVTGNSKTLDLSGVSVTKDGTTLTHTAYLNGTQISGNSVTINAADGAKQTLTFKATGNAGYDKDGNSIEGSIEYTWTVTIEIATLSYPAPVWNMNGTYKFEAKNSDCVYVYQSKSTGYAEAVPIFNGIKVNYYDKNGKLVELDLSSRTALPSTETQAIKQDFTVTLDDGSTLTMNATGAYKSGVTSLYFTNYNSKVYAYPSDLKTDSWVRPNTTSYDFNITFTYQFTDPNGLSTEKISVNWYSAKADNVTTSVSWKEFDADHAPASCVSGDTLITLADGSQKRIDALTYDDMLLAWDFETGTYAATPAILIDYLGDANYEILNLNFSDGTTVKVINAHGFFDADINNFVYITEENVTDYIGHEFVKHIGDGYEMVTLDSYEITQEYTGNYSVQSAIYNNTIVGGMFSMTTPDIEGWFDYFHITEDMVYDQAHKQAEIEKYGLADYEQFAHLVTYEQFVAFNGQYMNILMGRGVLTMEDLEWLIERYLR